jgi:ribosomal protein S26
VINLPISVAPYKRTYRHTKGRGKETNVTCEFCKKRVPRYKAFVITKMFKISDPFIMQQVDKRFMSFIKRKIYVCPACARFRGIVQPGKSVRKKHLR